MTNAIVQSIIRWLITSIGVHMVTSGLVDSNTEQQIVGSFMALITLVWGAVFHYYAQKKINSIPATPEEVASVT